MGKRNFVLADGLWEYFHILSEPSKHPITTEQALRRLYILGYAIEDKPTQKTIQYMEGYLSGKKQISDRREKTYNWNIFTDLIILTSIHRFTKQSKLANQIADKLSEEIASAFSDGEYI